MINKPLVLVYKTENNWLGKGGKEGIRGRLGSNWRALLNEFGHGGAEVK